MPLGSQCPSLTLNELVTEDWTNAPTENETPPAVPSGNFETSETSSTVIDNQASETSLATTNCVTFASTLTQHDLEVPSTPCFNPTANSTVCNKRVRSPKTPSPVLKIKVRKHGASWRLQRRDEASLRRSKRTKRMI